MRCPRFAVAAILALFFMPAALFAQITPQEQYAKVVNGGETVSAVDGGAFGETVDLSTGGVEFITTDVSIPGNSSIPVAFGRRRSIEIGRTSDYQLGDWDIDVPFVEGTYAQGQGWVVAGTGAASAMRCANATSVTAARPGPVVRGSGASSITFQDQDYWLGTHLQLPGAGRQELLVNDQLISQPAAGGPFRFVTSGHWFFACNPLDSSGDGDGFKAFSPDGLIYKFNHMVTSPGPTLLWPRTGGNYPLARERVRLYVSQVADRFNNVVNYNWNGNQLNTIVANDGRKITITYDTSVKGGVPRIARVSAHTTTTLHDQAPARIWQYGYAGSRLTSVTQPNGSSWNLDLASINFGLINYEDIGQGNVGWDNAIYCNWMRKFSTTTSNEKTAIITHPSGAKATFTFEPMRHGRSNVTMGSCSDGINANKTPERPARFDVWSIKKKVITGPGLPPASNPGLPPAPNEYRWTYSYHLPVGYFCDTLPGTDCSPDPAKDQKTISVLAPDGSTTDYVYGIRYGSGGSDGQLLSVTINGGLRTETYAYVSNPVTYGMPEAIGTTPQPHGDSQFGAVPRPQTVRAIAQNDVTFTRTVQTFDYWGNPKQVTKANSLGNSKVETTTYEPLGQSWLLGLVSKVVTSPGNPKGNADLEIAYDGNKLPWVVKAFGKPTQTATYASDGTLQYLYDGNSKRTQFANYHRGIAKNVTYDNNEAQSAEVNDFGQITSVTDEVNKKTKYTYKRDGRLEQIAFPDGDTPASNNRNFTFELVGAGNIGIQGSLWQQTVTQGSAVKQTYFDALWRPILTYEEDTSSSTSTARYTRRAFDFAGRESLVSYPVGSIGGNLYGVTAGARSFYDGLGRLRNSEQDAESPNGMLTTSVIYASGSKSVTNARGKVTTTSFQTFDEPTENAPFTINAPETVSISIQRDAFGKPQAITRSGSKLSDGTALPVSATRDYFYDDNEQLCKTVDPELGATVMEYDGAGNVIYSGQGLSLSSSDCNAIRTDPSYLAVRTQQTYDARNRPKNTIYADSSPSITRNYYPDGALLSIATYDPLSNKPITWTYGYNARRLLTSESLQVEDRTYLLSNDYTANGHLRKLTYPDALEIDYAPNDLGEPTRAGNTAKTYASNVSTYPNGAIQGFNYGNGIIHSLTQNTRKLPLRSVDSGDLLDDTYRYDANANVASIVDGFGNVTRSMSYDDLDRLETMSATGLWSNSIYKYDALDNIRFSQVGTRSYEHKYNAANNQIESLNVGKTPIVQYSHTRGNVTQRGSQGFVFDRANRIVSTSGPAPANTEFYAYDGLGRRVKVLNSGTGLKRLMVYSQSGQLRFEMDEAQAKVTDYVYLGGSLIAREESTAILPPTDIPVVTAPPTNSTGSYSVSWTSSARATLYKLEEQKDGGAWAVVCQVPGLLCAIELRSNGDYFYRARACNSAGCSDAGTPKRTQVTGVIGPPAPGAIVANPNPSNTGNFEMRWAPVGAADNYRLERKPLASGNWTQVYFGLANAFPETGIEAGQYQYRVSACSSACGTPTAPLTVTVTIMPGVLAAPAWISPVGTNTTGTFTLSWSNVSGRTSYQIQELAPGNWAWANQILNLLTAQSRQFTRANGIYAYQIRTCNAAGCGDFGPIQTVTVAIPEVIGTPANFSVSPNPSLDGHPHLNWDDISNTTYELQRRYQSNGTWANLVTPIASEFDDSILTNGQYQYRVRACRASNDCGNYAGPISLSVEIPIQPPGVVAWLSVSPTNSTNGAYALSWAPSTGATSYRITETINGSEATYYFPAATSASPETYAFTNRGNGQYVYKIAACNEIAHPSCSIDGTAIATVTVAIIGGIAAPAWIVGPHTPPRCDIVGTGQISFLIGWTSVAGATRYQIYEGDDWGGSYPNPIVVLPDTNPNLQTLSLTRGRGAHDSITYNYGVRACNATTCSEERRPATACLIKPGSPNSPEATLAVRYLHTDALGSPVAESDESGYVVKRTRYEPYGAPTDGNYVNGPGFTGHVTDAATGLTYMQQRYYDPMAGQFLSLDPVTVDGGTGGNFNRYWYANNNPYRFVDPDGRQSFPFGITPGQAEYARAADAARANYGKALAPVAEAISFALPKAAFVEGGASVDVGAAAPSVSATGSVGVHMPFAEGSPNNFYASGGVMAAGPNSSASLPAATEGTLQFAAGASVSPGLSFGITNAPTVSTFSGQTSSVRVDTPAVTIQGSLSSGGIWSLSVGTPAAGISAAKQEVNTIPLTEKMQ